MSLFLLGLLASVAHAACTFDATDERLAQAVDAAEAAYVTLDVDEFQRATTEVDFMVPCLVEPIASDVAVRLHRLRGLGQFIDGQREGSEASLRAARYLSPDYVFPESVLPKGFELRDVYEALPTAPAGAKRLPKPRRGRLLLDGIEGRERSVDAATLLQVEDAEGGITSQYLRPADPTPFYPGVNKTRTTLLITASATAAGAAVFYGLAWSAKGSIVDATNEDELVAKQSQANGLVGASTALAVGAGVQAGLALWLDRRR